MKIKIREGIRSFGGQLIVFNVLVSCIVVGSLITIFMVYYTNMLQRDTAEYMDTQVKTIIENINLSIDNMDVIATQLSVSPVLQGVMKDLRDQNYRNDLEEEREIKTEVYQYISTYLVKKDTISTVRIFNKYYDYITVGEIESDYENVYYKNMDYIEGIESIFEETNDYSLHFNKMSIGEEKERISAISVVREISSDIYSYSETAAYVDVEMSVEYLQKKIDAILDGKTQYIIYDNEQDLLLVSNVITVDDGVECTAEVLHEMYGKDMYISESELTAYNMTVMVIQSSDEVLLQIKQFRMLVLVGFILLIVILGMIQRKFVKDVTKPLITLCETVKNRNSEEAYEIPQLEMKAEFKWLSDEFNDMMRNLEESMEHEAAAKTGEVKAQLLALQSQMNPHFIHNTLAIIQAYANEENYEIVNTMCEKLSSIIRYSSNYSEDKVELSEEILYAQNYIDLVKLRYEENVDITITHEEQIQKILVPRCILQPLIENSLEHGLKKKHFPWNITVTVECTDDYWNVCVRDNGCGMTQSQIAEIKQYVHDIQQGNMEAINENLKIGGLSIKNILSRLYLEYGKDMIVELDSQIDEYTQVVLGGIMHDKGTSGRR